MQLYVHIMADACIDSTKETDSGQAQVQGQSELHKQDPILKKKKKERPRKTAEQIKAPILMT